MTKFESCLISTDFSVEIERSIFCRPMQKLQSIYLGADNLAKPDYQGYLEKQSSWLKQWRHRHFKLVGNRLYYSVNEQSAPHGFIDLASAGCPMKIANALFSPSSLVFTCNIFCVQCFECFAILAFQGFFSFFFFSFLLLQSL